jgi:type IV secretion system protein VirB6
MACASPLYGDPFLSGILNNIDCQTQAIAGGGYQALSSSSTLTAPLLLALMTLFIAMIGLRMLSGYLPALSEIIVLTLKLGIALTLATSWVTYRTVVYSPVLKGPSEVAGIVGQPASLAGNGDLVDRLQAADDAIVRLTELGAGRLDRAPAPRSEGMSSTVPARAPIADDLALGLARIFYLVGVIGSLGIVRLTSGILLAIAPLIAGTLLFEATRGLFVGWLRMLVASALGAMILSLVLAVELDLLAPWLASAIAQRETAFATVAAPIELLAMTLGFAIVLLATIGISVRLAFFATPRWIQMITDSRWLSPRQNDLAHDTPQQRFAPQSSSPDRIAQIVHALAPPSASPARTLRPTDLRSKDSRFVPDMNEATTVRSEARVATPARDLGTASRIVPPSVRGKRAP